jgi:hypothetical protein
MWSRGVRHLELGTSNGAVRSVRHLEPGHLELGTSNGAVTRCPAPRTGYLERGGHEVSGTSSWAAERGRFRWRCRSMDPRFKSLDP